jgi:hypothetical protein
VKIGDCLKIYVTHLVRPPSPSFLRISSIRHHLVNPRLKRRLRYEPPMFSIMVVLTGTDGQSFDEPQG